jgi:mono/diheme cytochrome c family protein
MSCAPTIDTGETRPSDRQAPTVRYTSEQAERGATVFARACARCHSVGAGVSPPEGLSGPDFVARWQSVAGLYNKTRWTMPADSVLDLGVEETLDVTAYLLQSNGFAAGPQALLEDEPAMKAMRLAAATKGDGAGTTPELGLPASTAGFYTRAQARRGKAFFDGSCRSCHDAEVDPSRADPAADATGDDGLVSQPGMQMGSQSIVMPLVGAPSLHPRHHVGELYLETKTTMPIEYPDGLSEQAYLDIVAYLLEARGHPVGQRELVADLEAMRAMTLPESGYRTLFNGRDFSGLAFLRGNGCRPAPEGCGATDPGTTFRIEKGMLRISGRPSGYVYTQEKFRDFSLRLDLRYIAHPDLESDADYYSNTGILLFVTEHQVWPKSLEVQGYYPLALSILPIDTTAEFQVDTRALRSVLRPIGQWNAIEVVARDGEVRVLLNDEPVTSVQAHEFDAAGHIGFQSEGAQVDLRNIRIRELR